MAALETKVETYEREINRLKRALERSDEYIEDMKRKSASRHHFEDLRPNEHSLRDGSYESAFTAPNSSSHDAESPLISMQRRIDELATVALATSNSPYSKLTSSSSHPMDMSLSGQLQIQYNVSSSENDNEADSPTPRSIFEDPSKFPACAKLIELTKVRRDLGEQIPGEIIPLDASGRLIDRTSNHSNSPRPQLELDDNKSMKALSSEASGPRNPSRILDSITDKPSTSGVVTSDSTCADCSPLSPFHTTSEAPCLNFNENCDPCTTPTSSNSDNGDDQQFVRSTNHPSSSMSHSYPSSIVLPYDNFAAKRIKVEHPE